MYINSELLTEQVDYNVVNVDTTDDIIDRADNDLDIKMEDIDTENKPDAKQVLEDNKRSNQNQVLVVAASCCSTPKLLKCFCR